MTVALTWPEHVIPDSTIDGVCVVASLIFGAVAVFLILRRHPPEPRPPPKSRGFEVLPPADQPESMGDGLDESGR